jgi:ferredoxin
MLKVKIDNIDLKVPEGSSVMEAAKMAGIVIPSMCHKKGYSNHPSCMVCLVKDNFSGKLFPSCAVKVTEGMHIITMDNEIHEARKDALELMMSDHVGDCEAPCRNACPVFMDIPKMNRLIASGRFDEAVKVVKEEMALPLILGYICDAPCEKVCRRAQVDEAVSICRLTKVVADIDLKNEQTWYPPKENPSGKNVAVVGAGPAGLACAFHLIKYGHQCVIFEKEEIAGGSLLQISKEKLPREAMDAEVGFIKSYGVEIFTNKVVDKNFFENELLKQFDAIVLATGNIQNLGPGFPGMEYNESGLIANPVTYETWHKGVFACGSIVRKQNMAVKAVARGKAAARSVNLYLHGKQPEMVNRKFNSKFGKLKPEEFGEYLKESSVDKKLMPGTNEFDGFSKEITMIEAKRCMHCDCRKSSNCKLRQYSDEYKIDRRKYPGEGRKTIRKKFNHELIVYEQEKCIKCGLCVDIVKSKKELTGLSFVGRGFDVRVGVPFNETLGEALQHTAILCAESCPTGAIALKQETK